MVVALHEKGLSLAKRRITSETILQELGYEYYRFDSPPEEPELVEETFGDLLPGLKEAGSKRCKAIASMQLYTHQKKAYEALQRGENIVLRSGTGSGKTEAWFIYAALRRVKTIAIYPTLALANDQLDRIKEYSEALKSKVIALDSLKRDQLLSEMRFKELRKVVEDSHIVITNPAFLLSELKKIGVGRPALLKGFLEKVGLLVVDDFDFYGPRSIALLFSIAKLLARHVNPSIQFAFMTAALENPGEVASYLSSINKRPSAIIEGRALRPENHYYVVLGKDLRRIWESLRARGEELIRAGVGRDVIMALHDFGEFKKRYYVVMEAARAAGIIIPETSYDIADILERYVDDDGVTLVFTRGIARSEELARRVAAKRSDDRAVAAHHHLLLKSHREEIESRARLGEVKVLFSPRTLSQGMDIGLVKRVVHVGLPDSVREFRQREGRKGRRPGMGFTETVIIPAGPWDRELLSRGLDSLRKWIELPSERIVVNPDNLYSKLFETLFMYLSPSLRRSLTRDDYQFLRSLGLERDGELTRNGKVTWLKMNFYEFAPSYGIKRLRFTELRELERLEDISHVDLVEKFQVGCIDYSSDGIVIEHRLGGKSSRTVTAVMVDELSERVMRRHDSLAYVLEEYEKIKARWGEVPSLRRDYINGKIHSEVRCVVHAPSDGFDLYTKIPNRVEWRILSDRERVEVIGERTVIIREKKTIEVPTPTSGMYSDYTYGISFEAEPGDSVEMLRLGLVFLIIALRRLLGIPFDTIKYDIMVLGERKVVSLHETESAGILVRLDWDSLGEGIARYNPDELDEIFMQENDEIAYSTFISMKLDWDLVKRQALNIIDYIKLRERLKVKLGGLSLSIPKPSRALKMASLTAVDLTLREDIDSGIYGISIFDGQSSYINVGFKEMGQPDDSASEAVNRLAALIDQGFIVAIYDALSVESSLSSAGLKGVKALLTGIRSMGKVIDVKEILGRALGEKVPFCEAEHSMEIRRTVSLKEITYAAEDEKRRVPTLTSLRRVPERLAEKLRRYLEEEARSIYILALVAKEIGKRSSCG